VYITSLTCRVVFQEKNLFLTMNGNQSTMSESRYDSASETLNGSFPGFDGDSNKSGSSSALNSDQVGAPPTPPSKPRMSFFSLKQFDPLLKTPANLFSNKDKTGMHAIEESPAPPPTTPNTTNGSSFASTPINTAHPTTIGDQLIPVTPMVCTVSVNGGNTFVASPTSLCTSTVSGTPTGASVVRIKPDPDINVTRQINGSTPPREIKSENSEKNENHQKYLDIIQALKVVNEELLEVFTQVVAKKDVEHREVVERLTAENEGLRDDLRGAESSFNELHTRYERLKGSFSLAKENEERAVSQVEIIQSRIATLEDDLLRSQEALAAAQSVESVKKESQVEVASLKMQLKRAELKISGLESQLKQKMQENQQLQEMLDEMAQLKG